MSRRPVEYTEGEIGDTEPVDDFLPPPENLIRRRDIAARFVVYRDATNRWRWSLQGGNGRRLAESAEAYDERTDCISAIETVRVAVHAPLHEAA